jgi:hypothetical protein
MTSLSHDSQDATEFSISPRGTQFIPRDGDEVNLWEVVEIMGEDETKYKVKWAGFDPRTGEPWEESWVLKRDCTDELVKSWKIAKALKGKQKGKKGEPSSS